MGRCSCGIDKSIKDYKKAENLCNLICHYPGEDGKEYQEELKCILEEYQDVSSFNWMNVYKYRRGFQ